MPSNQMQQWQLDFERAFISYLQTKTSEHLRTGMDAFRVYERLGEKSIGAIWVSLSDVLRVQPKKIHDFYHNSFSKRYYADFSAVRDEAVKYFEQSKHLGAKGCVRHVIDTLKQAHPGSDYHFQTVYQFCLYRLRRYSSQEEAQEQRSLHPRESEDSTRSEASQKKSFLMDLFDTPQAEPLNTRTSDQPVFDLDAYGVFGPTFWDLE